MQEILQGQLESGKQYYIEAIGLDENKKVICRYKRIATFVNLKNIYNNAIDGPKLACFKYFRKINDDNTNTNSFDSRLRSSVAHPANQVEHRRCSDRRLRLRLAPFDGYDVELHELWFRYYEVKKYKIQQNMETKVCDIMLRNITGDEYFQSGF